MYSSAMNAPTNDRHVALRVFLLTCTLFSVFLNSSAAQGDLLLFPKRVVFDDGQKSETINLTNIGKDTATYKISFIQIRMLENGNFETIAEPDTGQFFADPFIRYYPRSVTLAPNESQIVKLQLKKTANLPDGEYRSHLLFRAETTKQALGEPEAPVDTSTTLSVKINALYGISIATIIRIGNSTAQVQLSKLELSKNATGNPVLQLYFNRSGNMSSYGNIVVKHVSPEGVQTTVGEVNGFAVYTPNTRRKALIRLSNSGVDYTRGKLTVTYSKPRESKSATLATASLTLGPNASFQQ